MIFLTGTQLSKHGVCPGSSRPNISAICRPPRKPFCCGSSVTLGGGKSLAEGPCLMLKAEH